MRAAQVLTLDGPTGVRVQQIPEVAASDDDVVIDVAYAGLTYPDVLMARGLYQSRPALPFTLGLELSGTVRRAPAGSALSVGDPVIASTSGAGQERVAVALEQVFRLPASVDMVAAAGIPTNYFTADFALNLRGSVTAGEWVLVHGAAGGVGIAVIQLAKVLGAQVVAVTSTAEKADMAIATGADFTVPVDGFLPAVKELTHGRGVDVVVDPVGGERFTDSLRALAPQGRLLVIGFTAGEIPTVKVNRLLLGNTAVIGVAWGPFAAANPGFTQEQWQRLLPHITSGALQPVVSGVYQLDDVAVALGEIESRNALGKLVIQVSRDRGA